MIIDLSLVFKGFFICRPTDMLFFFFYMSPGEALQILAGTMLISRGWRWSKSRSIWIAKADGVQPEFQSRTSESGFYQVLNRP